MCPLKNNRLTTANRSFVWRRNWWHTLKPRAFGRSTCCPAAYSSVTTRGGGVASWLTDQRDIWEWSHFCIFRFLPSSPNNSHLEATKGGLCQMSAFYRARRSNTHWQVVLLWKGRSKDGLIWKEMGGLGKKFKKLTLGQKQYVSCNMGSCHKFSTVEFPLIISKNICFETMIDWQVFIRNFGFTKEMQSP